MLSKTFNLLFFLKKPKNYKKGQMPIYMRLTVDGIRIELSTQRDCEPEKWNSAASRKNGNKEDVKILNAYLDMLQNKAYEAHRFLVDKGIDVTAENLREQLNPAMQKVLTLVGVFIEHNDQMRALIGKDFTESTCRRYEAALGNVQAFLKYQ